MSEVSAYHEAGHALMAFCVGAEVRQMTIEPQHDDRPPRFADIEVVWPADPQTDRYWCERAIRVALAGPVAEMIYRGEPWHPGFVAEWAADWQLAWESAAGLHRAERPRLRYLEQVTVDVHRFLRADAHWAALAALVDELLAHETLEGEQIAETVAYWLRR
jgi:ATP-dependent Zn protease